MSESVTSAEQLRAWIAAAFPTRPGWTIEERQTVRSFQQSLERVTLRWDVPPAREDVFVRVYRGYLSWWTLTAPDLPARERVAREAAARAGVPVAAALYEATAPDVALLRAMPGEAGRVPQTPKEAEAWADTLAHLHAAPAGVADRAHLPDVSLRALIPRLRRWAEEAESGFLRREVDTAAALWDGVEERPSCLIHGDLHPGNVLSDAGGVTAVLDWEEAALGDPRLDVANIYPALVNRAPAGTADRFLRRYAERTGVVLDAPRPWLELTDLRSRVMSAWVKRALARGQRLPSDRPEGWIED